MLNELENEGKSQKEEFNIPAAITDIGCEREINEDRYAVVDSTVGRAWIVCDGMGGTLGGELAAQLAVDSIRRTLESRAGTESEEAIRSAIQEANRIIVLRRQNPAFSGMGTTIVSAMINDEEVVIAHAGDSRAYLIREGEIQQLTIDHTYVQDLIDQGAIEPEQAMTHPQSHVLTRCLGAEPRLEVDTQNFWIWKISENEPKDSLLLCSDGLYSHLSDQELAAISSKYSPQEACVRLVELAKSRGGYDNITIALIPVEGQLHDESSNNRSSSRQLKVASVEKGGVRSVGEKDNRLLYVAGSLLLAGLAALILFTMLF